MKVALLLTGHPRTYKKTIDNLKKSILDNYDVDIYFFTWNKTQGMTLGNKEFSYENFNNEELINVYDSIGNLVKYKFGDIDEYKKNRFDNINLLDRENDVFKVDQSARHHGSFWVERLRDQWYGVKECFSLVENASQYECIIRARFDIDLYVPKLLDLDFVIYKDEMNLNSNGFNYTDHFAYGKLKQMKKYCHLFDYIPDMYYNFNVDISCANKMVKYYMEEYSDDKVVTYIDGSIKGKIVR
jgi:hypothetical protein